MDNVDVRRLFYLSFGALLAVLFLERARSVVLNIQHTTHTTASHPHLPRLQLSSNYKPELILHLGPPKTASTTLQCEFMLHSKLLEEYSPYRYIGRWETLHCKPTHKITYPVVTKRKHLYNVVSTHLQQSKSPIFSQDQFSLDLVSASTSMDDFVGIIRRLKQEGFDTKLVATYRRYFEWAPSYYRNHMTNLVQWSKISLEQFMNQHLVCAESFQSYVDHLDVCRGSWTLQSMNEHPIQMIQNAAANVLNMSLDIFNMHDNSQKGFDLNNNNTSVGDNLVQIFASQILDNSLRFQAESRKGNGNLPPLNTSQSNRIAREVIHLMVQIYKMGLVSNEVVGGTLWRWLKDNHATIRTLFLGEQDTKHKNETVALQFPETCPEEALQNRLLELSLEFEKDIFPEWSMSQIGVHREAFQEFVKRRNYCQWDWETVLKNEAVVHFIREGAPGALHDHGQNRTR